MIAFDRNNTRFQYRIAGVAWHNGSVLLHKTEKEPFWSFPGGRAEFGESSGETLKREMMEEIGTEVEVGRLLWFVENFFRYEQRDFHEIGLYYLMHLPAGSEFLSHDGPFLGDEGGTELIFQWFPCRPEVLSGLPLMPSFLQTGLLSLPESVEHIIHWDKQDWDG